MTDKTTEALKMTEEAANRVIETLEYLKTIGIHPDALAPAIRAQKKALTAVREALAETVKQEPVAWHLDAETAKFLADMITADDEPTEITLRLGFIRDDDGKVQYGLLVEDSEYPEEGACLLVECEPLNAAPVSAKREWVELTDYEVDKLLDRAWDVRLPLPEFARTVITAFKEKNK